MSRKNKNDDTPLLRALHAAASAPSATAKAPTDKPPERVWIDWESDPETAVKYEFKTLDELNAFLEGIEAASTAGGIVGFTQYDSEEELAAARRKRS